VALLTTAAAAARRTFRQGVTMTYFAQGEVTSCENASGFPVLWATLSSSNAEENLTPEADFQRGGTDLWPSV